MIRFLFRLLGFLILAAGFVAFVIDGTRAIASGTMDFTLAETSWAAVSPDTLQAAREALGAAGASALNVILAQPTCLVLGVIGLLFMLIGRRRHRPVGVAP
jgi:hypothetical protein